jgi:ABC-type glycerol-3-phosphate transport system substrate-binding protein
MFISGKSAMYIGYPTEIETIRKLNPNLNFAMTMIPQISADARKTDYAQVYSLGISKISKNQINALGVLKILTSKDYMEKFINGGYYAPARKDLLNDKPKDNDLIVTIYNSAIISKSFFDPNSTQTKNLLTTAINQINSGARNIEQSLLPIYSGFREITAKLALPK